MTSIRKQIQNNAVALISLVIALSSLGYNTWRNETTEEQRNIRHAAFRVLESLGDLQEIVDTRYYYLPYNESRVDEGETRIRGFGIATMVRDLTSLMPPPADTAGLKLREDWLEHFVALHKLDENGDHTPAARLAETILTKSIAEARQAVLDVLHQLE